MLSAIRVPPAFAAWGESSGAPGLRTGTCVGKRAALFLPGNLFGQRGCPESGAPYPKITRLARSRVEAGLDHPQLV